MTNKSMFMPTYMAYGGVPEFEAYGGEAQYILTPYGVVKNDNAYKKHPAQKLNAGNEVNWEKSNIEVQSAIAQKAYTTESAWGYPNNTGSAFYNKMGRPYSVKQNPYKLGTLSGLYESNNGQKLWNNGNRDKTGGWSYGLYQIATKNGTMNDYLRYLQEHPNYQNFYQALRQAGGENAALVGDDQFKNAWADLSDDVDFLQSQQDFIVSKKLNPALKYIDDIKGINLDHRSPVIRDALYSTATQHGEKGTSHLMHQRFGHNADISALSDDELINQIYDERSDVNYYFRNSTQNVKNIVKKRFKEERRRALELLKIYP